MIDQFGLLFSTVMLMIVIVRAVRLDRSQSWFERQGDRKPAAAVAKAKTPSQLTRPR